MTAVWVPHIDYVATYLDQDPNSPGVHVWDRDGLHGLTHPGGKILWDSEQKKESSSDEQAPVRGSVSANTTTNLNVGSWWSGERGTGIGSMSRAELAAKVAASVTRGKVSGKVESPLICMVSQVQR